MSQSTSDSVADAVRDGVPFLVITAIWIVVMLVIYGAFLLTKPDDVTYDAWVHASVFVPPMVGYVGHVLHQVLKRYAVPP